MNKVRRIARRRGRRPFQRYGDHHKTLAVRGTSDSWADSNGDAPEHALADDSISASHLRHRSVRSEALEDYTVHSIHLSPESVISSKLALDSVHPVHLTFNPVQAISGLNVLEQFGNTPFSFSEKQDVIHVTVPLPSSYRDEHYVIIASCNHPAFHACIQTRRQQEAVIGITRNKGSLISEGWLSWIAIGSTAL
ncbi:hypothetical protein SAMN05661091_4677 [Paenibacillus uliginis N3/975]|uniref:WIAG-tail domain n=1 Tax=Paenibacillus uliginis N3/975 TaxID=1313296 RepID=A0A1X7HNT4_9BACL|nr:WIAG-tail domain [Paenibacillus uliginis]SMF89519.1 hypothetical protein SAMN05661091_4677 [Paenibacillus uliginis N3/975]